MAVYNVRERRMLTGRTVPHLKGVTETINGMEGYLLGFVYGLQFNAD